MSQLVIDLKEDLKRFKASEEFIAFAGFALTIGGDGRSLPGVLKIAEHVRPSGGGYLTLTFLVDTCSDTGACSHVERLLALLNAPGFKPALGPHFQYLTPFEILMEEGSPWFMGDMNFYFDPLQGHERELVGLYLLPALAQALPVAFEAVQWWSETA